MVTALLGGEVPVIVGTPVLLAAQIQGGAIRGLAVTSPTRTALLPDVPTVQEAGIKGYDVRTWAGLLAPEGCCPPSWPHSMRRRWMHSGIPTSSNVWRPPSAARFAAARRRR